MSVNLTRSELSFRQHTQNNELEAIYKKERDTKQKRKREPLEVACRNFDDKFSELIKGEIL